MDYESLHKLLPKEPRKWQVQDVGIWLSFIGLAQLQEKFADQSIDGSVLDELTEEELEQELGITQRIVKKKILNWLNQGLKEYSNFLSQRSSFKKDQEFTIAKNPTIQSQDFNQINNDQFLNSSIANPSQVSQPPLDDLQPKQSFKEKIEHQLILQPLEGQLNNFYCIRDIGAKIGRHSSNQILILEENISRHHAEVVFQNGMFAIKDIGSTTGTYVKILKSQILVVGMLIELGSNLFNVQNITRQPNDAVEVTLCVVEGPNQEEAYSFVLSPEKTSVMLGRKNNLEISFQDDHHLSNQHAKFSLMETQVMLEDHSSTNGTWQRLSPEGQPSQLYFFEPNEQYIIRIGTTNQYMCQQNKQKVSEVAGEYMCIICCEKDRDALFLPCKHNATCLRCSKNLQKCPICRVQITEQIRIYKN